MLQTVAHAMVRVIGPGVLKGQIWTPPFDREVWDSLNAAWRDSVGPFDELAVYERPQASRSGLAALLLRGGRPVGFVKARAGAPAQLELERVVLDALAASRDEVVRTVSPLAAGLTHDVPWLLTEALPTGVHRPGDGTVLEHLDGLLSETLAPVLPPPSPVEQKKNWRPMHGDLTPWNLRALRGRSWLVDWEDASWGPPGADATLFMASAETIGLGRAPGAEVEAVEFWLQRVADRPKDDEDADFNKRLFEVLRQLPSR
jgi:hypothetical protein